MAGKSSELLVKILGDSSQLSSELGKAQKKAGIFASTTSKVIAGGMLVAGAAIGGAAFGLVKLGDTFDSAYDTIRIGTGATGDALVGLQDDFKAVFRSVPTDAGTASTAIADLNTALGLTGKPLQDLSTQMINLSRITDSDLGQTVQDSTRLFGDWGIATENQATALDTIFKTSQSTGIAVGQLSQQMVTYGAPMRELGFSFEETAALLGKFQKEGVNAELVMGGLKQGLGRLAKAGKDPQAELHKLISDINEAGLTAENKTRVFEMFGARAGIDMAKAIEEGRFSIEDLVETIGASEDTINGVALETESFGEKWTRIKNQVFVALEPIAMKLFNGMSNAMDKLAPIAEKLFAGLSEWVANAWDSFEDILPTIKDVGELLLDGIMHTIEDLQPIAEDLIDTVQDMASSFGEWVRSGDGLAGVLQAIAGFAGDTLEAFGENGLSGVLGMLREKFDGASEGVRILLVILGTAAAAWAAYTIAVGIMTVATGAWAAITTAAGIAVAVATSPVTLIIAAIAALAAIVYYAYNNWGAFRAVVDSVGRFLRDVMWPIIKNVGEAIGRFLADPIPRIKAAWEGLKNWFRSLPGWFKDRATDIGRFMIEGIRKGISNVAGIVTAIPLALIRGLKNLVNSQVIDRINTGIPDEIGWGPIKVDVPDNPIPRLAYGTSGVGRGSVYTVGERGAEDVFLPTGTSVIPAHRRKQTMGNGITVYATTNASPYKIAKEIAWRVRKGGR